MSAETPLGRYLQDRWSVLDIKQAEFARRVDTRSSHIYLIRKGMRKPPLEDLATWITALELVDEPAQERLEELMRLGHALPDIQERYEDMRAQLQQKRKTKSRSLRVRQGR